ncbi:MAG: DUF937 domain-containing protein [Firmicutes bacterium]|nr:DUF937 domain-containing protein [Bacillota bacterium]
MNLLNILMKSMMTDSSLNSLSQRTGLSSKQLKKLLPLAIPLLLKFMTKNASSQAGATSLLSALTQHNNTQPMAQQLAEADTVDGSKILAHILGSDSQVNLQSLSGQSGLSQQQVASVLNGITPAMLSSLSAATNATSSAANAGKVDLSDGLDLSDVMNMLGGSQPQQSSGGGLLSALFGSKPTVSPAENDNALNGNALLQALLAQR